ncbi:hypothetical protein CQR46_0927 [Bifidobacterium pseudolongum subsp. globosum]|uniref:Uncharacterized protein n=1 Tax=Bifidobacterium pseudolongum subsp. globosum TaxID=1690 RepID=A0A2N3QHI9_9BIFI|nr:hypothetical protein [Bifidobacterium pseudolongum]PKU90732.1 hypothetical protein CQR46_0927 [Bifidobacterium pseudolongum subsp. globosum]
MTHLDTATLNTVRARLQDRLTDLDYEAKTLGSSPTLGAMLIQQMEITRIIATIIDPLAEQAQAQAVPKPSDMKGKK